MEQIINEDEARTIVDCWEHARYIDNIVEEVRLRDEFRNHPDNNRTYGEGEEK